MPEDDYKSNLRAIWRAGFGRWKHLGYIVSMVSFAVRGLEVKRLQQQNAALSQTSSYVGEIGERLRDQEVEVFFIRAFDGNYGTTYLIKFRDGEGNQLNWWASNGGRDLEGEALERSGTYSLTATVKRHDVDKYTGAKVTTVARARLAKIRKEE
jgi:hypothetical protein